MFMATKEHIDGHYPKDEEWLRSIGERNVKNAEKYGLNVIDDLGTDDHIKIGKMAREWLIDYMTSGPMVKMVIKGIHAIEMVRKIVGPTMPAQAEMGTIRGDFSVDDAIAANKDKRAIRNLVHASGNQKEAEHELLFWFSPEEINDYKRAEEDIMF